MILERTRQAMANDVFLSLLFPFDTDRDVLVVKTARKIFHTEWSDEDISVMCNHIKKSGTADLYWPNDTEWIFNQINSFAFYKATDYQMVEWYKGIFGDDKALKNIIGYEQEFLKDGVEDE